MVLAAYLVLARGKKKSFKKEIALTGERLAGKTQLFLSLSGSKAFNTVPSINNNVCALELGRNSYQLIDFIGDNLSK